MAVRFHWLWACSLALILGSPTAQALDVVSIAPSSQQATAYERDQQPNTIILTRTGGIGALTVAVQFAVPAIANDGIATIGASESTPGADYLALVNGVALIPSAASTAAVTFADGERTKTITILPIDDNAAEGAERATLSLVSHPSSYTIDGNSAADVVIGDNDVVLNLVTSRPTARETALASPPMDTVQIDLVWRKADGSPFLPTTRDFPVTIQVLSTSTAMLNQDYYLAYRPASLAGSFRAIGWNNTDKKLTISSSLPKNMGINSSIWVRNDVRPRVITNSEWNPVTGDLVLTLDSSISAQITLPADLFYCKPASDQPDTSYQLPTDLPIGDSSLELWFVPIQDPTAEGHETIALTVMSSANYLLATPTSATATIADDDLVVSIRALSDSSEATPTATGAAIIEVWDASNHPLPAPQDLRIAFRTPFSAGSATSAGGNPDFTFVPSSNLSFDPLTSAGSILLPAGHTSATIALLPFSDSDNREGTETVTIKLLDGSDYVLLPSPGSNADTTATINILDCQGLLSVAPSTTTAIPESPAATASYIVTLARSDTSTAVVVPFSVSGASASDYWLTPALTSATAGSVTIPSGSTTAAVLLSPLADIEIETTETLVLTVSPPAQVMLDPHGSATAALSISDTTPRVALSATPAAIRETGGDPATIIATLYNPPAGISASAPFIVLYAIANTSSATSADVAISASNLTFTDINASGTATASITVSAQTDALAETTELLFLAAQASATCAVAASEGTVSIDITDNTPQVTIARFQDAVEGGQNGLLVITNTANPPGSNLLVSFSVNASSTASPSDYASFASSISVPPGSSATVAITAYEDGIMEGSQTVIVTLDDSATGSYAVASPAATVTITEQVAQVGLRWKQDAVEGAQNGIVEAYLLPEGSIMGRTITIPFGVAGDATTGTDYTLSANAFTIPAGSTSSTITLVATEDNTVEKAEKAIFTLSNATDGSYLVAASAASATLYIADYLPQISITATQPAAVEGGQPGLLVISYAPRPALPTAIPVGYALSGTATYGLDFRLSTDDGSGTLTIPANTNSITLTLVATDDVLLEGAETAVMTAVASKTGAYQIVASQASATVTITDKGANKPAAAVFPGGGSSGGCGLGSGLGALAGLAAALAVALRWRPRRR
ncbi:MAG: hypothetical protein L6R48_16035 [Planctomycetes bacterium]|nr:hypothetical protein [Planctomycetota bacterium]